MRPLIATNFASSNEQARYDWLEGNATRFDSTLLMLTGSKWVSPDLGDPVPVHPPNSGARKVCSALPRGVGRGSPPGGSQYSP
jgi:hypothetical protein